ncbi:MIT C-terminal domain-containing protein [Sphingobium yanoikuyae]|uniref:MIT C-terminal domain-containing protein n=1 Tax=Sphingobium yanoikuyae TaxID=13690 RepID=UPI0028AD068F|nr:MIT C-terminal domain-containing protein [Sphingobium yanoikuyae]
MGKPIEKRRGHFGVAEHGGPFAEAQVCGDDSIRPEKQAENLGAIAQSCEGIGISFTWEFDQTNTIHARHIVTDTGWKIALDRGLDIFQQYELNDAFSFANRLQQFRSVKAFEVIYLRTSKAD